MLKRIIAIGMTVLLGTMSLTGTAFAEDTEATEVTETVTQIHATTQDGDYNLIQEEGAIIEGDGYTIEIRWCGEEGKRVFGRTYYPADFDENQTYTTVVMNHGGSITADIWDKYYAPTLAQNGYICYAFDCRSGATGGRGSFSDPAPDGQATVETYSEDLCAALDLMEAKTFVDQDHLYLMGQSMGGVTVQNVAAQRPDEIAGVVVLYGSIGDDNSGMVPDYEWLKANPYNAGEVLFVQGTEDNTLTPERTIENMNWYERSSFVLISQASHGFGFTGDRPARICTENVIAFIERTSAEGEK